MGSIATDTESTRGDLGQGLYSLDELRVYVAYHGTTADGIRVFPWLNAALNPVQRTPKRPDYSFSDLISLFVVRELVERGVPLHRIRAAEDHLRRKWHTDRPFVSERIATDGREVYVGEWLVDERPHRVEAASRGGQQTMLALVRDDLLDVQYRSGEADAWQPAPGLLLDPAVQFGEPVIEGTRVPARTIAAAARQAPLAVVAQRFRISEDAAAAATHFDEQLTALRRRI